LTHPTADGCHGACRVEHIPPTRSAIPIHFPKASKPRMKNMIRSFDYTHNSSCGVIYHLAAYWKARSHQLLVPREAKSQN
jgi:hypothetical protein